MRITVLAYNLIGSGGLSVGRNVTALLPELNPEHQYLMLVPEGLGYEEHKNISNVSVKPLHRMNILKRINFDHFSLPKMIRAFNTDIVLALGNLGVSNCACKQAVLIHQPQVMYSAKYFGNISFRDRLRIWAVKRRIKKCLDSTDIVFCQTPVAQKRFAKSLSYPVEKIKILPNAVSQFAIAAPRTQKNNSLFQDNSKFNLFFLTRYMPHKNLEMLIELFRLHINELKDIRCIVTIEKKQHKNAKKFLDNIKKYKLQDNIINVGKLLQEELAEYFLNCDAFLFPTLLESFSGTYLEAMHFGLPILTSDLDFARYVCDDAALYFDPWDSKDIANKILFLKNNPDLRRDLTNKGNERISVFFKSWEEIVINMLKEIEALA